MTCLKGQCHEIKKFFLVAMGNICLDVIWIYVAGLHWDPDQGPKPVARYH
jgi:hypothetical protein